MKKVLMRLCVFVCATLFIPACISGIKEKNNTPENFPVTSPVVMDTIYTKEYVADIHSLQHVEIRARIKGYIEKIHVDEGAPVKSGQLLFSINRQEYEVDLLKTKAIVKAAEVDLQNVKTLVEKNVVSKTELELAQAKLDEAKADEASADLNLSYTSIKAPFDGIINRIPYKTGSLIDEGTLLTSISDNKNVFAYFNMSEKEYLDFILINNSDDQNEATLTLANNQLHKQKGTVETVDGEFNKTTGNIAFRARFANPEGILRHGSSGKIKLKNELKNAMLIPQKSTFEIQEKLYVFVVDNNNVVHMKSFMPKLRLPYLYVVESGLTSADKIIYEGIQRVKEGDKITSKPISAKEILAQQVK